MCGMRDKSKCKNNVKKKKKKIKPCKGEAGGNARGRRRTQGQSKEVCIDTRRGQSKGASTHAGGNADALQLRQHAIKHVRE